MNPTHIIIHCSDSEWGNTAEIRKWHIERGFRDVGYHFVILNGKIGPGLVIPPLNGSIEIGRPLHMEGAHCLGYNDRSIGVVGIARRKWTDSQVASLVIICRDMQKKFPIPAENILGHCETENGKSQGKTCPNLDMDEIRNLIEGRR